MQFRHLAPILIAFASCGSGNSAHSSIAPSASIEDSYPFVACKSVACDSNGAIFDGAGGGILNLVHTLPPTSTPLALAPLDKTATLGFVVGLAATPEFVYAATFKNGLVVVRRSDDSIAHDQPLAGTEGAWSVAVLDANGASCPNQRIIVVGTRDPDGGAAAPDPSGGRLVILAHDLAANSVRVLDTIDVGAPVETVAASSAIAPPPSNGNSGSFSVLLGADCATFNGELGYLQRRDFSYDCSSGALELVEDGASAWPGAQIEPERIIRSIAIDDAAKRAYVGAYFHGVFAFDVAPGHLDRDPNSGWPIRIQDAAGNPITSYADTVALDPAPEPVAGRGARLIVGWGSAFQAEWQYFGASSPHECATPPSTGSPIPERGLFVYRLDAQDEPEVGSSGVVAELSLAPSTPVTFDGLSALAVERISPSLYYVYAALDVDGLSDVRVEQSSGAWSASIESNWSFDDPGKLALGAHDDALVLTDPNGANELYVATENSAVAFDLDWTASGKPLFDASCADSSLGKVPVPCGDLGFGGVTLTGFANPSGRLYAATVRGAAGSPGGLRVYDASTPSSPRAFDVELDKEGRGFGIASNIGLYPPATQPNDRPRYVFTTQSQAIDPTGSFTVKVWDMGSVSSPSDPGCSPPCTPPRLLANWFDAPDEDALEGVAVEEIKPGAELAAYVPYGVNSGSAVSRSAGNAGVVVLSMTLDALGQLQVVKRQKTVDFTEKDASFPPARATLDAASHRLYVCWGTGGIAIYDVSSPYHIARLAERDFSGEYGAYHLRISPTQMLRGPSTCGSDFVYVAFVNDGIGVLDLAQQLAGPIHFLPTRGQTISVTLDPRDASRRTLFVSEGRAGIDQVKVDFCGP